MNAFYRIIPGVSTRIFEPYHKHQICTILDNVIRAAIHEAGHAVVGVAYGYHIRYILLGKDRESAPNSVARVVRSGGDFGEHNVKVAGYIAERLWQRKPVEVGTFRTDPRYGTDRDGLPDKAVPLAFQQAESVLLANEKKLFTLAEFLEKNLGRRVETDEVLKILGVWCEGDEYVTKDFLFHHNCASAHGNIAPQPD